jgi:hypothetical protein
MKYIAIPLVYEKKHRKNAPGPVFIEASNQVLAHATAINVYRMMHKPVRFVRVEIWNPWEDPELLWTGFVRKRQE